MKQATQQTKKAEPIQNIPGKVFSVKYRGSVITYNQFCFGNLQTALDNLETIIKCRINTAARVNVRLGNVAHTPRATIKLVA